MRTVESYERFHRHIVAWREHEIDALLVLGRAGYGKSHAYKSALTGRAHHVFGGRQSPLRMYITLHDAPALPVVLDDISALLRDANFIDLLKGLCETERKVIRWGTTTRLLAGRPTEFVCTSPVLIVLNQVPSNNPDVLAILDRCDGITFEPTKAEVIAHMRAVFPGDADLIEMLAELPVMPSLRTLVKARQWQRSRHLDLVEELFAECGVASPVVELLEIMETGPERDWCDRYVAATGLTDRSYRRHKQLAIQLLACRKSQRGCPPVRLQATTVDEVHQ